MKSVFITGASSGLGKELAALYKKKGWRVGVCARREELLEPLRIAGAECFQADVTNSSEIRKAIEEFGATGLDLLIANAGKSYSKKSRVPDFEEGKSIIEVNLIGLMNTLAPATEIMVQNQSGQMAVVASIAGLAGFPGVSAYSASKAGAIKLIESLGLDLKKDGIRTSAICPGFIDTPLTQKNPHPMPSMVSASDAANIIYNGLERGKKRIYFPFWFTLAARILGIVPRGIFAKIMSIKKLNYSREE